MYIHDEIILVLEMIVKSRMRHSAVVCYLGYGYLLDTLICCKLQKGLGSISFVVCRFIGSPPVRDVDVIDAAQNVSPLTAIYH